MRTFRVARVIYVLSNYGDVDVGRSCQQFFYRRIVMRLRLL